MKKERPILFQTEMVKAILEGRKTMTRRIIKPQPNDNWETEEGESILKYCPYGEIGDVLWVRETFSINNLFANGIKYTYKADLSEDVNLLKWKPSIFMPKEACRIWLQIADIKTERLQDISEEDAIKEGVEKLIKFGQPAGYKDYLNVPEIGFTTAKESFRTLWISINGEESWNQNPWVWCVSFKRLAK